MIRLDYLLPNTFDNLVGQPLVVLMKQQCIQCSNQSRSLDLFAKTWVVGPEIGCCDCGILTAIV